jgi:hypothetical protein
MSAILWYRAEGSLPLAYNSPDPSCLSTISRRSCIYSSQESLLSKSWWCYGVTSWRERRIRDGRLPSHKVDISERFSFSSKLAGRVRDVSSSDTRVGERSRASTHLYSVCVLSLSQGVSTAYRAFPERFKVKCIIDKEDEASSLSR